MNIEEKDKVEKKAHGQVHGQVQETETGGVYSVRDMFRDLSKWEQIIAIEESENQKPQS